MQTLASNTLNFEYRSWSFGFEGYRGPSKIVPSKSSDAAIISMSRESSPNPYNSLRNCTRIVEIDDTLPAFDHLTSPSCVLSCILSSIAFPSFANFPKSSRRLIKANPPHEMMYTRNSVTGSRSRKDGWITMEHSE